MGQTLSSAAQWTSAHEGGQRKLEFSSVNEFILKEIVQFVEELAALKNDESSLAFKRPLTWLTGLEDSEFGAKYHQEGLRTVSNEVDNNGQPTLTLQPKDSFVEVSVSNFEKLGALIAVAGCRKLLEASACLEANQDPVANILGDQFTTAGSDDIAVYRLTAELSHNLDSDEAASAAVKKATLGLLLRLESFDSRLLRESIERISAEIKLSPEDVNHAYDNLKTFSGPSADDHLLKEITWLPQFAGVNNAGCRAPPWRQLHGDISYILVTPHDGYPFVVTASTHGYFVNRGLRLNSKDLNFEKQGDYYKDLMTLLRHKSPQFNLNIEKQDIFKAEENFQSAVETGVSHGPSATTSLQAPSGTEVEKASVVPSSSAGDGVNPPPPPPPVPEQSNDILSGQQLQVEGFQEKKASGSEDQINLQPALKKPKLGTEDDNSTEMERIIVQTEDEDINGTKDEMMNSTNVQNQISSVAVPSIATVLPNDGTNSSDEFDPETDDWFKYPPGSHVFVDQSENADVRRMDKLEMDTSTSVFPNVNHPSSDRGTGVTIRKVTKDPLSEKAYYYSHLYLEVIKETKNPVPVSTSGDGLQKGYSGKESIFIVNTVGAELGPLLVGVSGPSKVQLQARSVDVGFEVRYTPQMAGCYVLTIKRRNVHVAGSPFNVRIEAESAMAALATATAAPGKTSSNVTAVGNGLLQARVTQESMFVVDASKADHGVLMVGVGGPQVQCEKLIVNHVGGQNYVVTYELSHPGPCEIVVKWGEEHINGSPFKLMAS